MPKAIMLVLHNNFNYITILKLYPRSVGRQNTPVSGENFFPGRGKLNTQRMPPGESNPSSAVQK
jgi:hypothetical protein